nr:alpha/beta hydrolase [Jannaschia sp. Os4]
MTVEAAPYHDDVAAGPPGGACVWTRASDGARLRVALWPKDGAAGTLVMFPGRTEYVEKYSDAAREMADRGWAAAAIDWRGQGLSDRTGHARHVGHVEEFDEFQLDVEALAAVLEARGMPRPWHLLAHSMGGLIGLRTLLRDAARPAPRFERAAFSGPMWGLPLPPARRIVAGVISSAARLAKMAGRETPGSGAVRDPVGQPFEGNLLTSDPEMFAWMKRQLAAHPDLALGGPSLGWLWAALREMREVQGLTSPEVPCLTVLGSEERIVDPDAVRDRMARWPGGRLMEVEGARHEALMEMPQTRRAVFDALDSHLRG